MFVVGGGRVGAVLAVLVLELVILKGAKRLGNSMCVRAETKVLAHTLARNWWVLHA